MFTKLLRLFTVFTVVGLAIGLSFAPKAFAQNVTVTPASALTSSTNPIYAGNTTVCLEVFNWADYISDINNGITTTNPYDNFDCLRQRNIFKNGTRTITRDSQGKITAVNYQVGQRTIEKMMYKDFEVGQQRTKTEFGNLPVLGVFPNGNYTAQALNSYDVDGTQVGTVVAVDRSVKENINTLLPGNKVDQIFSTGGSREGMPRSPQTGQDGFNSAGLWTGGFCKVENGQLKPKTIGPDSRGNSFTVADYGLSTTDMITTCAWPDSESTRNFSPDPLFDEGLVKDNNVDIYQFVFKVPYPCEDRDTLFPGSFDSESECMTWFRERYSLPLTGSAIGDDLYYTYTFYGAWNDIFTQFIGYDNPDVNKVRQNFETNASLEELREYYQEPQGTFADLSTRFEGWIRSLDGYSIYTF